MKKSRTLLGMPVISLDEGRRIGHVKGLIVNPGQKTAVALVTQTGTFFKGQKFITFNKIKSVGADAIIIDKSSSAQKGATLPEIMGAIKEQYQITGSKLIDTAGNKLGRVDDFYVDLATGAIKGLEFSSGKLSGILKGHEYLDMAYVNTVGKETIIVSKEHEENTLRLSGGIFRKAQTIRASTGQFVENVLELTKTGLPVSQNGKRQKDRPIRK